MILQKDWKEFIELLNSESVDYLIVGAHALAYHGEPRTTIDIDFWIRISPENAERVARVVSMFGFPDLGFDAATFQKEDQVFMLGRPPLRIDILTSISGVGFDEAWDQRVEAVWHDLPVRFISRDLYIQNKRAAGRPKDLGDLDRLGES